MRKKDYRWLWILLPLLALISYGGYDIISEQTGGQSAESDQRPNIHSTQATSKPAAEESTGTAAAELTEEADQQEEVFIPDEAAFMQDLHKMTHQKVYASLKWGTLEITEARINEMLEIAEQADYEQGAFYREALLRWAEGDFSNAVEVHNQIWELQEGTIGKAKRLLTPEEEAGYVEQYLR